MALALAHPSQPPPPPPPADGGILGDLLSKPLKFGPPVQTKPFDMDRPGMKVIEPGPPSPPPPHLRKALASSLHAHASSSQAESSTSRLSPETTPKANAASSCSSKISLLPSQGTPTPTHKGKEPASSPSSSTPRKVLYPAPIELGWPAGISGHAAGLHNPSMACYANATMQVLLHTPPVLNIAKAHRESECKQQGLKGWCMLCLLRDMAFERHWAKGGPSSYSPKGLHAHLSQIKKGFSRNRQEDTHEFFRFVTDALQASALAGYPKDLPNKLKHTSWVYSVWGGRVRSRVVCSRCNKPSDTFDDFLDLSLDVNHGKKSLLGMLQGFVREDRLDGDNKYHCENCKAKAVATKSFRIDKAPPILTFHLKRFAMNFNSYNGKAKPSKFNQFIHFDRAIDIAPFMVDPKSPNTRYRLFAVTCHQGESLRWGHYTSHVRGPDGRWYTADDDDVVPVSPESVLNERSAYLLSYIRDDGSAAPSANGTPRAANGHAKLEAGKRKRDEEDESEDEADGGIDWRKPNGANGSLRNGEKRVKANTNGTTARPSSPSDSPPPMPPPLSTPQTTPPSEDRPSRFTYKPAPRPTSPTPPLFKSSFDGAHSPVARSPSKGEGSSKWLPGNSRFSPGGGGKKHGRKHRDRDEKRRGGAGAPMPFAHGGRRGGGGGGGGFGGKSRGVIGRMKGKNG